MTLRAARDPWHKSRMADLLDEMWTVMRWHLVIAVVFWFAYGNGAALTVVGIGLAWCLILLLIPARQWTPRR